MALKGYRRLTAFIPALLLGYLVAAVWGVEFANNRELFPFFTWQLFTHPKREQTAFALRILAIDGEPLEAPTAVADLEEHFGLSGNVRFQKTGPGAKAQKHVTIEGAGHFLQEQKPRELANAVMPFMADSPL